jgi:hypothetical protein
MSVSRRAFLGAVPAALAAQSAASAGIGRRDVVSRHDPTLHGIDPRSPLSVGNGGLLLAIAHMVRENAFPRNWNVRHEGFPPAGGN